MENVENSVQENQTTSQDLNERKRILINHFSRAENGDAKSMPLVRTYMDGNPGFVDLNGDLAMRAQLAWIHVICREDLVTRECILRKLEDLRNKFSQELASGINPIFVEEVLTAWLRKYASEVRLCSKPDESLAWSQHRHKEFVIAQGMYERSIAQLFKLRTLSSAGGKFQQSGSTQLPESTLSDFANATDSSARDFDATANVTSNAPPVDQTTEPNGESNQLDAIQVHRRTARKIAVLQT